MNLGEVIADLESCDDSLCIVAKRPWTSDSEAKLLSFTEDFRMPEEALASGYEYFLEVSVALEEVIGGSGAGLSSDQRIAAVIYYAENDAYPEWLNVLRSAQ